MSPWPDHSTTFNNIQTIKQRGKKSNLDLLMYGYKYLFFWKEKYQ